MQVKIEEEPLIEEVKYEAVVEEVKEEPKEEPKEEVNEMEEILKQNYLEELAKSNLKDKTLEENMKYMMNMGYLNFRVNYNLLVRNGNDLVISINKLCNNLVTDSIFEQKWPSYQWRNQLFNSTIKQLILPHLN